MEQFMDVEGRIVQAQLRMASSPARLVRAQTTPDGPASMDAATELTNKPRGPFRMTVLHTVPGQELTALCRLDLDEELFLLDHTLGRSPSARDLSLKPLSVVPLTVSIEIMAQAAALLSDGQHLIAVHAARAYRWIEIEETGRTLRLRARRTAAGIYVQILDGETPTGEGVESDLLVEGTLAFADRFPEAPTDVIQAAGPEITNPWSHRPLYDLMFHGPRFQTMAAVSRLRHNGAEATLHVPQAGPLFRNTSSARLFTDPVLLDGAGQLIGYWGWGRFGTDFTIFPVGFQSLQLYRAPSAHNIPVRCISQSTVRADGSVQSDMDLLNPDGRVVARFANWLDTRIFDWTGPFMHFAAAPREAMASAAWDLPASSLVKSPHVVGARCQRLTQTGAGIWPRIIAHLILSRTERTRWTKLSDRPKRSRDWLHGRLVAKDALRRLVSDRCNQQLLPADIEIETEALGRPIPTGEPFEQLDTTVSVSIAHADDYAVAIAVEARRGLHVGIDVEQVSTKLEAGRSFAFAPEELALLSSVEDQTYDEWLLRLWCAKEAVAKAIGTGLGGSPRSFGVQAVDTADGNVTITLTGQLARLHPDRTNVTYTVTTGRDHHVVFAVALA
jgi:phosphopantetheine--protein transferase-like protein